MFPLLCLLYEAQIIFLSEVTFPPWPGKSVHPNFRKYQSDRKNDKFNCCFKVPSKTAARIYICALDPLKLSSNQIPIWRQLPVVTQKIRQPQLFNVSILQKQLKIYLLFQKSLKNGCNNFYFHLYTFNVSYKSFFIWRYFPVAAR